MPWTETTRRQYERHNERYSSDVTDEDRAVIFPLLSGPDKSGRPREIELRDVWDGIGDIAAAGGAWSLLPKDFPPVSTVRSCFHNWRDSGLLAQINHAPVASARQRDARDHQPTAGVIDSQSVTTTENDGISGDDAGNRIKGRKRHIMTDTCGHLMVLCVDAANIQDRDAAVGVFQRLRRDAPKPRHVFADCGYRGPKPRSALIAIGRWTIRIVKRCDTAEGFEVLPRRWVVEPTCAWLGRCRRLAKDWEKTIESADARVLIAHIRRITRRLARA